MWSHMNLCNPNSAEKCFLALSFCVCLGYWSPGNLSVPNVLIQCTKKKTKRHFFNLYFNYVLCFPRVLMVLGAGRGPLVNASLRAAKQADRKLRVYAVEKNPNAVVTYVLYIFVLLIGISWHFITFTLDCKVVQWKQWFFLFCLSADWRTGSSKNGEIRLLLYHVTCGSGQLQRKLTSLSVSF